MKILVLILATCFLSVLAEDNLENAGVRLAFKIYEDCSASDAFSSCLKKKAITFLDRLGRMEKFSLTDGITIIRTTDVQNDVNTSDENLLEKTLYRSADVKDDVLNTMLLDKIAKFMESRTIEITMPKFSLDDVEEGRKGSGGGGGGGGGGKGGMKGMMSGLMMGMAAKMAALIPVAIAGLFLLAGKALITAKIALLLSGIIAIKKLFGSKQGGSGGGGGGGSSHGGGWQSSGHGGGGWQSGGGGWDKRSIDNPQHLAYSAYSPK